MLDNKIPMPELIKDWSKCMPKFAKAGATYNRHRLLELARTLRYLAAQARYEVEDELLIEDANDEDVFGMSLRFETGNKMYNELWELCDTDFEDIEHNMEKYIQALRSEETAHNASDRISFCFAKQLDSVTTVKNLVFLVAVIAEELGITALDTSII